MNKILLMLVISLTLFTSHISYASAIAEAYSAYFQGNYQEAINIYNTVIRDQGESAALLFNLGNAYLKDDNFAQAMLAYQRAKKLDPSNAMINSNLNYLKEKVEDANKAIQKGKRKKVTEDAPNFFQTIHIAIAENNSSNKWGGWAAAFFLIFSGCVALYLFVGNVIARKFGFFGGLISLGLSMIFLVCAFTAASSFFMKDYGIVMAYKTPLQIEPNKQQMNVEDGEGVLTRGTKIRIISEETDAEGNVTWYKVRLNSDYVGWLPAEDLEII